MKHRITILLCFISILGYSQDTTCLKVHFLYGSKPLKKYKHTEKKWFGGVLGGHVGIEGDSDKIVNFGPSGRFHLISRKDNRHSMYAIHSFDNFYAIMGGKPDSMKKAIVYIPVTPQQKARFDSIATAYLQHTPYDYAFFGMRCSAAAYDILGQLGIVTNYRHSRIYKKIFYPKKLRRILLRKASENNWLIVRHDGSRKRKWERD
jgi:hypothetical protein